MATSGADVPKKDPEGATPGGVIIGMVDCEVCANAYKKRRKRTGGEEDEKEERRAREEDWQAAVGTEGASGDRLTMRHYQKMAGRRWLNRL